MKEFDKMIIASVIFWAGGWTPLFITGDISEKITAAVAIIIISVGSYVLHQVFIIKQRITW